MKIGKKAIYHLKLPKSYTRQTGWTYHEEDFEVVLMATSGKWAMVRRPRCIPFCCEIKELKPITPAPP
jgi:hypothetical protein